MADNPRDTRHRGVKVALRFRRRARNVQQAVVAAVGGPSLCSAISSKEIGKLTVAHFGYRLYKILFRIAL